jgi:intein-encoded DNA endonuclease-like protein
MEEPFHATSNNPIGEERKISLSQNNVLEWRQMNSGNVTKIKIYYQVFSLVVMVEGVIRKTSSTSIQVTITEFMVRDNNLENLSE